MNLRNLSLSIALLPLALACSSTTITPSAQEMNGALGSIAGQDGRDCLRIRDISGYGTLNDTTVSVSDKFRGHYLLVTSYRCPNLESSSRAAFKGGFTEFCGRRDSLLIGGSRCPVQSVYRFENRNAAFDAFDKAEDLIKQQRDEAAGADS